MVPVLDVEGLEVSPVADDVGVKNEELIAAGPAMKRGARKSFPKERRSSVTYDARIKMNITNRESHHILKPVGRELFLPVTAGPTHRVIASSLLHEPF
jgi:hypothetical protein